ncbi:TrkH family potassium uptake protein [Streptomyces profundus]|uniref:TrkH family potassium uptake protein n=1 Tax=Streptomyces profundus TaxID=2867410 RepID=UPI001D165CC4|nr:potassium transporter TrkG [Streptomyces sp. MA3_2.13]UED86101.1 TrkH family potassium uptake protein [Streptomyces sp. MA3_2.13]
MPVAHLAIPLRRLLAQTHPARLVVLALALAIVLGTVLLKLPVASAQGESPSLLTALFTATSGVCVTGLFLVDTGTYWSGFGDTVVLALVQIGGFGIMTLASLLALLVAGKLRLRTALSLDTETSAGSGDIRRLLLRVALITVTVEAVTALLLTARLALHYQEPLGEALYHGVFHAISAFNNAGLSPYPGNLTPFAHDPWTLLPIALAALLGGLGFPVIIELLRARATRRERGFHRWSLHLRLTLATSALLLVGGTALTLAFEWSNAETFGSFGVGGKLLNAFFHSTVARTAGFNTTDIAAMEPETLLGTSLLMFVGGGSAGTAGGIKVTTVAVLGAAVLAEVNGQREAQLFGRRLTAEVVRQALTVTLLSVALVTVAAIALMAVLEARAELVIFTAVSAFGTAGLHSGLVRESPASCQLIIIALMFIGRVGPITLVSALALRARPQRYRLPAERPIIG